MPNIDQARVLMEMAQKDLKALKNMVDPDAFDDEIFGFHAQQAAEKTGKAWLAVLGHEYPLTHDLSLLLGTLESLGQDVGAFWDLLNLAVYAVRFRYESYPEFEDPIDRVEVVSRIADFVAHVGAIVDEAES